MDLSTLVNRQIRLAQRPKGLPGPECWQLTEEAVVAPQVSEVGISSHFAGAPRPSWAFLPKCTRLSETTPVSFAPSAASVTC